MAADQKPTEDAPSFLGVNSISLNKATMVEVVRFWISRKWAGETPDVTNVAWDSAANEFKVTLRVGAQ